MNRRNALVATVIVAVIALLVGIGLYVQSGRDSTGDEAIHPTG
jgi:hypothetical protein